MPKAEIMLQRRTPLPNHSLLGRPIFLTLCNFSPHSFHGRGGQWLCLARLQGSAWRSLPGHPSLCVLWENDEHSASGNLEEEHYCPLCPNFHNATKSLKWHIILHFLSNISHNSQQLDIINMFFLPKLSSQIFLPSTMLNKIHNLDIFSFTI